jgi:hypothetical protein
MADELDMHVSLGPNARRAAEHVQIGENVELVESLVRDYRDSHGDLRLL